MAVTSDLTALLDLTGKTAVVTGGGKGMGVGICRCLARAGATVCVADIDDAAAQSTVSELTGNGGSAYARRVDMAEPASVVALVADVVERSGSLDIWVNNAGVYPMIPLFSESEKLWDLTQNVNLRGVFVASREAARQMIAAKRPGVIVNIASIAADRAGHVSMTPYAASKAGVKALTRSMAAALGPFGIRVVAISPGVVETDGMAAQEERMAAAGANTGNRAGLIPLRRIGTPEDVGRAVLFMVSDLAGFVTGTTLDVDGGDATGGRANPDTALSVLGLPD
jgi:NAD(P)-dependent dehydrogenase (short-subunit alcohol dehydrogenase family)